MLTKTVPSATKAVLSVASPFKRGGSAAGLPRRVKILGWGENIGRTTGARILVDDKVVEWLSVNQALVACDRVPMDYEHQSVKGHPNYQPDPRFSPGGGTIEAVQGEGVFLSAIDYSGNGEEHADSYQDVSAVVHLDKDGRPLWISSVALTQLGDVAGMELTESIAALSARINPIQPPSNPIPERTLMENRETALEAMLIKLLGLKPGESGAVTDEEIAAAYETHTTALSAAAEKPKEESTAALSALVKRFDDRERMELVAAAGRDGKRIPLSADMLAITPIAILSAIIDGLEAGEVALSADGSNATKELPAARVVALSADEKAAAKSLGLTEEAYRKAKV